MKRGFTLVETIVVIGIIGLVTAITFPVFASAKRSAKETRLVQDLRSLHMAAMLYQADQPHSPSGTPEEMGLPPIFGTVLPATKKEGYLQPFYKSLTSQFGEPGYDNYHTFAIPGALDGLQVTWESCTTRVGDECILYWDPHEPGRDSRSGWWKVFIDVAKKKLHGISLAGNLVLVLMSKAVR